jgi:branched-chain amino acid transport system permease protein
MTKAGPARDALLGLVVFIALAALYQIIPDPGIHDIILKTCIFSIFALSLNLLIGYLGLVSFGHAAFFAAGAYVFGLFMQSRLVDAESAWAVPVGMALGITVSAVLAAVIGAICVRAKTIYFSFLTLAFQMVLYSAILAAVPITGGDQGLMGGFPKPVFLGIDLRDAGHMYLFCAAIAILCALILRQITESPFGYALRMMRDNPERAAFLGLKVKLYQWIAFVIAGALASVAGMLQTLLDIGAFPEWAFWAKSAEPLFMILLGGMQTFLGPVVGAFIFEVLNAEITSFTRYYGLVFGIIILFFALGLRRGLLDFAWDLLRKRKADA